MQRSYQFDRKTLETHVKGSLNLDGQGAGTINTGIGFLDHMLQLFQFHANFDLSLVCKGDLHVCPHHTIEDIALTLGDALLHALGDRRGITRYATCYLPMDETLTRTVLDISGRPYHVYHGELTTEKIGELPTEMVPHFFYSFCSASKITLHQEILYGANDHHRVESLFKGFARALSEAVTITNIDRVPSSKGVL